MSMSTHVVGIKPPDAKWLSMKAAWDACEAAGVSLPDAVLEFFDHTTPDPVGVVVELEKLPCCKKYHDRSKVGFEIDLKQLPPDVTVIRFVNSY